MLKRTIFLALSVAVALLTAGLMAEATRPDMEWPAKWEKRDQWQDVDAIFAAMGVTRGSRVADLGSRDGYLSLQLAAVVGDGGRVFAVDIDDEALERLDGKLEKAGIKNVTTVHSRPDDPMLPRGTLDAAVIVNAYHEMDDYEPLLRHLRQALKPGGRLVIVDAISEGKRGKGRKRQTASHEIDISYVRGDLEDAGFKVVKARDPFVERPDEGDEMWLLAAIRDGAGSAMQRGAE